LRTRVAPGAEEFVEHVVLVGGDDEPLDRQPHAARDVSRVTLPKLPEGTEKETGSPSRRVTAKYALK